MERTPLLFLFLDGVGLGPADPAVNPFHTAEMPNLRSALGGRILDGALEPFHENRTAFRPIDATLGMEGTPESATGQSTLLSGINVARAIGGHYGPKPDARIRAILQEHNLVRRLSEAGRKPRLLNAYPESYVEAVRSGKRLHAAIPLAFALAGIPLASEEDLNRGSALSADFTGRGWRSRLQRPHTPILTPESAGRRMAELALENDFTVFDHWPTDFAGHYGEMRGAVRLLGVLDGALGGILERMQGTDLTLVITSDHGNLEDLSIKGHTRNPVPLLALGPSGSRKRITDSVDDLTGFAPAVLRFLRVER
jgi:2,3-bisphosphoglycerate-independent phosphoglycerate mutase